MFARIGRLLAWALTAMVVVQAAPAATQSIPPPPLLEGELLVRMANGCGSVVRRSADPAVNEATVKSYTTMGWRGECRNGLAHGRGVIVYTFPSFEAGQPPTVTELPFTYFYGRIFGRLDAAEGYRLSYVALDGRSAGVAFTDVMTPRWSDDFNARSMIHANGAIVATSMNGCFVDRERFRGCTVDNDFKVYGLMVIPASGATAETIWCPDPRTTAGCEGLWRERVAPLYAAFQALATEVDRDTPAWRNQLTQLNAPREAQIAALENARREAAARQQAEAQAAAEKAEKDFQTSLATGNPGQLFALADELQAAGERDKARQVLRALVSKFPSHPLAVTAAQQLSQMASGANPGASASAAPSSSRPGASAPAATSYRPPSSGVNEAGCKAEVERLANALNASQSRTAGNAVWQMETLMFVLKSMADATDAMCPRTQVYINASAGFRKTYNDTARTCGQVSSQGACTPRMH